ncbi:transporter [Flavobacterium branchiophilum]|uniref:Outer membrane protein TolC n=1 Tax=Flavobacterium branchiophilum TaxID=55197 RepID=A0A543G5P0_9FLAO|nr:TolC family protein [Flavobacterium branchiophilum]OXA74835.1 transporter [Flavobacterium branchiophilum] [Flavobacterium branchiophilum NBRC 15030 = ATCC 35035]TQM41382.1 outer membrane protein TolC [Flavobacterium branchiophilum]GEM54990.1 membrane protein [Flavobacterium branchiophilum NBRC 15030 = ATCC 35035]
MNLKKKIGLFFTLFLIQNTEAQDILTIEKAAALVLEHHFDIKLAQNDLAVAQINNTIGNAGMLPNITASINNNNSLFNTTQTQSDGNQKTLNGAKNSNLTYGVGLDWTLFDGMKMFAKREQLKVLEKQSASQLKLAIVSKMSELYQTYYGLIQQKQQLKALDTAWTVSKERLQLAQNRYSIGKASKLEVLNAQVDLNSDQSLILQQKQQIKESLIALNQLTNQPLEHVFEIENDFNIQNLIEKNSLLEKALQQNPQLQTLILSKNAAEWQLKQAKASRYPVVKINTGYNFTHTEASLGFVTQSSGKGLVYGFSASVPVFNGNLQQRNEKLAQKAIENTNLTYEKQKLEIESQLSILFERFKTHLNLIDIEAKNVVIAKQNLDITLAKFKIGTISTIELRTAQLNYVAAQLRWHEAQYQAKQNEILIKELTAGF